MFIFVSITHEIDSMFLGIKLDYIESIVKNLSGLGESSNKGGIPYTDSGAQITIPPLFFFIFSFYT